MILSVRAGNELKYLQMHHRVPSSESFWPLCTWVTLWCAWKWAFHWEQVWCYSSAAITRGGLFTGSAVLIPTPMARLILMLGEILRRIQSGIVGDVGCSLWFLGLALEWWTALKAASAIRLHSFKDKLCASAYYDLLSKLRPALWMCGSQVCNKNGKDTWFSSGCC